MKKLFLLILICLFLFSGNKINKITSESEKRLTTAEEFGKTVEITIDTAAKAISG